MFKIYTRKFTRTFEQSCFTGLRAARVVVCSLLLAGSAWVCLALTGYGDAVAKGASSSRQVSTASLGWEEGDEVGEKFAKLLESELQAGDTLFLDHMYRIDASELRLLPGMTITGADGAGFDVITTPTDKAPLFVASDGLTVSNLVFRATTAPETNYLGTKAQAGEHFHPKRVFLAFGHEGVTFNNIDFRNNMEIFIDAHNSPNLTIEDSYFEGGKYQVRLLGSTDNAVVSGNHFRHALGDGIKTERDGALGPRRISVTNSFFEDANRDGIDSTGGFRDGRISDTVFYANGIDLKVVLEDPSHLNQDFSLNGVRIDNIQVIDEPNAIVVTMLDRIDALTADNADTWMPHDILVTNSIIESTTGEEMRAFLIKDGYDIRWKNMTFLGNVKELRLLNEEAPDGWSAYDIGGTSTTLGDPRCTAPVADVRLKIALDQEILGTPDETACPLTF